MQPRNKLAAGKEGSMRYNDSKSAVVYDIYERTFMADPAHRHVAQSRS